MKDESLHINQLTPFVKKKGVGKTMSKALTAHDCQDIIKILANNDGHPTTDATLRTALLMLPLNDDETNLLNHMKKKWPNELGWMISNSPSSDHLSGQKLLKKHDLTEAEIKDVYALIMSDAQPEPIKAVYLEALRLKSESPLENTSAYDAFWNVTKRKEIEHIDLIDLCYPYDGFNRFFNLGPFLASLLASIGYPTILHGTISQGPKYGITHAKLLDYAKKSTLQTHEQCILDLQSKTIGWTYCDIKQFHPILYHLQGLRARMVKRPVLATIEKHLQPIRSKSAHHVVAGYTHPPYKEKMVHILNHNHRCTSFVVFRGTEGSPQLQPDRQSPYLYHDGQTLRTGYMSPDEFQLKMNRIMPDSTITVEETLRRGVLGLKNQDPITTATLLFSALGILKWISSEDPQVLLKNCRQSLENGRAFAHWQAGMIK